MFDFIKKHRKALDRNTDALNYVGDALFALDRTLRYQADPLSGNGPLVLEILETNGMSVSARLKLPQPVAGTPEGEVVKGEAKIVTNGVEQIFETTPGQEYVENLTFEQNDQVSGSFEFIDNNGNRPTTPKTFGPIEIDTIGVEAEGEFGLEITGTDPVE